MRTNRLERVRVQSYGSIVDLDIQLTPLHALIGPNDSGKTTILRALRLASALEDGWKASHRTTTGRL